MKKKAINPFYIVLVLVGLAFTVTATAYGVMCFRDANATLESARVDRDHPLWKYMESHGELTMGVQLAVLAVATFLAIGTDDYWTRRSQAQSPGEPEGVAEGEAEAASVEGQASTAGSDER